MSSAIYGGDEISALVIDTGSRWTRIGFAGEDTPRCVLPTFYGVNAEGKRYFGENHIFRPQQQLEIKNPMKNGWIEDWDAMLELWEYGLEQVLQVDDPSEHPILVTEPFNNPPEKRQKTLELIFDVLGAPAAYLAKQEVCAAFSNGKGTACVIDVGAERTTVAPVLDGFVLQAGYRVQDLAGASLNIALEEYLNSIPYTVVPTYLVKNKQVVPVGEPPKFDLQERTTTDSFHALQVQRVYEAWKEECAQVCTSQPFTRDVAVEERVFQFPDGKSISFGAERYEIPERLFTVDTPNSPNVEEEKTDGKGKDSKGGTDQQNNAADEDISGRTVGLGLLVRNSISACDVDLRTTMLSNIVVCGGTSLMQGFTLRLQNELTKLYPGSRLKIHASGHSVERTCASWLGGSILASLGTFHQLWVSKAEYEENINDKATLIEKRCK
ncbi:actin-like protein Arp4 [Schizosaccharomyces japonicus yFS275]|uniref:Actin-like protein Arp4 n=1 Tax=Schizosaccharomyces japonicus (strain yFS275 / FY16936) TaxID=402676 RepID=B6K4L7_SCHJY|nr:actin-like protein Arp4 [Schizosaccharomyces japonicus yFS275]EEB08424.1 actin-like protein Arp4 [Schizosaccharomyces japonicus yFS275]